MSQPFVGQVQPMAFNFPPKGWAQCDGQILPIAQNTALFSLLGTFYGGNGTSTFALPDLRSRVPIHAGSQYVQGESGGAETVTLTAEEMPLHNHAFMGTSGDGNDANADSAVLAHVKQASGDGDPYYASGAPTALAGASIPSVGGNQPHTNIQPYQAVNWCIALVGIYPSRN